MEKDNTQTQKKGFALYRLADQKQPVYIGSTGEEGAYSFRIAPFHLSSKTPTIEITSNTLRTGWEVLDEINIFPPQEEPDCTSLPYEETFRLFHRQLETGACAKLVLSKPFGKHYTNPKEEFRRLCAEFPHSMVYLLYTEQTGLWIGATPELLLSREGDEWETMALAGTKDEAATPWDEKNRREQEMVRQYILDRLQSLCQRLDESETTTLHTGGLYHLCTRFRFKPREEVSLTQLTQALHPTPAICGLPKEDALRFILQHEGYERGYYAGYLGPVTRDKEAHLYVNIRCAQLQAHGQATVYAGSGLLKTSEMETEKEEIEHKSNALFNH